MQPGLAALQPPVLADRRFGQSSARLDREQRERAQRLRLGRHGRVTPFLRDHPLGEVVRALEALPACDRQLAAIPQRFEHHLRRLPVPHAAATLALEVPGAERALGADPLEHRLDEVAVLAQGAVVGAPVTRARHHGAEVRPQLDREQARLVGPVLEDPPLAQQAVHRVAGNHADPRRQRQAVRAIDGRDRVELNCRQPANRRLDLGARRAPEPRGESLPGDDESPHRRDGRDLPARCH